MDKSRIQTQNREQVSSSRIPISLFEEKKDDFAKVCLLVCSILFYLLTLLRCKQEFRLFSFLCVIQPFDLLTHSSQLDLCIMVVCCKIKLRVREKKLFVLIKKKFNGLRNIGFIVVNYRLISQFYSHSDIIYYILFLTYVINNRIDW